MVTYWFERTSYKSVASESFMDAAEEVWAWVQRHGGQMAIRRHGIEFSINEKYSSVLPIICPLLVKK
jgi:hypothetical protein